MNEKNNPKNASKAVRRNYTGSSDCEPQYSTKEDVLFFITIAISGFFVALWAILFD